MWARGARIYVCERACASLFCWTVCQFSGPPPRVRLSASRRPTHRLKPNVHRTRLCPPSCDLRVASCELRVASCKLRAASCNLRVSLWLRPSSFSTSPQSPNCQTYAVEPAVPSAGSEPPLTRIVLPVACPLYSPVRLNRMTNRTYQANLRTNSC